MVETRNVFDSEQEFNQLRDALMSAIDGFSESRGGNVTYGEIMFVLEAIIDEFGQRCEDSGGAPTSIDKMTRVAHVRGVLARTLCLLTEKGIISKEEEAQLVSGA
ncbi:MAG: hypothetical protein JW759_09960 [Candidatus Coatesbacteria bacterium]|nr:hypothetical protein [Candidatus Coatesbacteria bacterium]